MSVTTQNGPRQRWTMSATDLVADYATGELSPVEVVDDLLNRIDQVDRRLHAFLAVDRDGARADARRAEAAWRQHGRHTPAQHPLCGVPVSVKDTIEIAGMPTTYGSLAFRDHLAPDSEIGRRLRAAGAVVVGKTNTSEFALSTHTANRLGPPTANPWNTSRTAGGSSGGAAAAVAAGLGPIGVGTDSAGSIRIPASFNGVVGFKPTFDAIPAVQRWRASPTRSHNGVLTRTIADTILAFEVLCTRTIRATRDLSELRFGVLAEDEDVSGVVQRTADTLARCGARLVPLDPPPAADIPAELEPGVWAYSGDHYAAAEGLKPGFWEQHADDLTSYARPIYEAGRRAIAWQYRRVLDRTRDYARAVERWLGDVDLVLSPVAPEAPPQPADDMAAGMGPRFPLVSIWNLTGDPAVSMPAGTGPRGLPVAVQIVGRRDHDDELLAAAARLEEELSWGDAWPDIPLT